MPTCAADGHVGPDPMWVRETDVEYSTEGGRHPSRGAPFVFLTTGFCHDCYWRFLKVMGAPWVNSSKMNPTPPPVAWAYMQYEQEENWRRLRGGEDIPVRKHDAV